MERVANAKIKQLENRVNQLVAQLSTVQTRARLLASDLSDMDDDISAAILLRVNEIADSCKTPEKVKI